MYAANFWCKSATSCLAVGSYGEVGMSTDGGVTWTTPQYIGAYGTAQDLICTTKQCIALIQGDYTDATTYSSTDGGTTWTGPSGL